jgi:hypothetical protein
MPGGPFSMGATKTSMPRASNSSTVRTSMTLTEAVEGSGSQWFAEASCDPKHDGRGHQFDERGVPAGCHDSFPELFSCIAVGHKRVS